MLRNKKWVGLNILVESVLIFLILVTRSKKDSHLLQDYLCKNIWRQLKCHEKKIILNDFLFNNNNIIYFNLTSQCITIVFKSVVWKKGDESFQINAVLGLGVGSNPGPLASESCVLPCAPLHNEMNMVLSIAF